MPTQVTINGRTYGYTTNTVWVNGQLVWTGKQVTYGLLVKLAKLLATQQYVLAEVIA